MIEIVMTGTCYDCPCADLELDKLEFRSFDGGSDDREWTIRCIHEDACERMENLGKDLHEDDLK